MTSPAQIKDFPLPRRLFSQRVTEDLWRKLKIALVFASAKNIRFFRLFLSRKNLILFGPDEVFMMSFFSACRAFRLTNYCFTFGITNVPNNTAVMTSQCNECGRAARITINLLCTLGAAHDGFRALRGDQAPTVRRHMNSRKLWS